MVINLTCMISHQGFFHANESNLALQFYKYIRNLDKSKFKRNFLALYFHSTIYAIKWLHLAITISNVCLDHFQCTNRSDFLLYCYIVSLQEITTTWTKSKEPVSKQVLNFTTTYVHVCKQVLVHSEYPSSQESQR